MPATRSFASVGLGSSVWRREKASNLWVNEAARLAAPCAGVLTIDKTMDGTLDTVSVIGMDLSNPPVSGVLDGGKGMAVGAFECVVPEHLI